MAKQTQANPAARRAELQRARPIPMTERGDKNARTTELKTRSSDKKRVGPAARSSPQGEEDASSFRSTPTSNATADRQPPRAKPPRGAARRRCKRRSPGDSKIRNPSCPPCRKNHECKPNPLPMARARAEPTAAVSQCRTTSLHNARPTVGRARNDTCERNAFGDRRGTRPQRASARCVARKRDRTKKLA